MYFYTIVREKTGAYTEKNKCLRDKQMSTHPEQLTFFHPRIEIRSKHSIEHGEALLVNRERIPTLFS